MSGGLISIPKAIYQEMIQHCRDGLPNEACGFLSGINKEMGTIATSHYPLANSAASPVYYRPDDKQMLSAMRSIDDAGEELVAIYHSHVASQPIPSPTDIREAHYPEAVYIIVSLLDIETPLARGWRIVKQDWRDQGGEAVEVGLVVD